MTGKHVADSTEVVTESDAMTDVDEQYSDTAPFIDWIRAAAIRAIKTGAQSLLGFISAGAIFQDVDWTVSVSAAGLAMLASVLTSIVGVPEVASGADVTSLKK